VKEFGEPKTVSLATLRTSIEQIDGLLRDHPDLLPHRYQFKFEYFEDNGFRWIPFGGEFDTGAISGLRPSGDEHVYVIRAGLNELTLTKCAILPDGRGTPVERRDIRGENKLLTTNCGIVRFRRRRAKSSLRRGLREIREFLATLNVPDVIKIVG
jgi:hypothetical protein